MPQPILLVMPSEIGLGKSAKELEESLKTTLQNANTQLPNYSKVATCVITKDAISVENGTLTPTLKVKRSKVHELYAERLPAFCSSPEEVVWE